MRKVIAFAIFFSFLVFLIAPAFAQAKDEALTKEMIQKMEQRITKLSIQERKELNRVLKSKLQRLRQQIKFAKKARQAELKLDLLRVAKEFEILEIIGIKVAEALPATPQERLEFAPPPNAPMLLAPKAPAREQAVAERQARVKEARQSVAYGIAGGYIANIPGVLLELRFFEPLELTATSLRIGAVYAQGEDSDKITRKHALLVIDGIYRLNPPATKGVRSYIGLGINYNIYTTGQKTGSLGGQAYYGMEGNFGAGQLFAEFGYGTIRTGFSPDYAGLSAVLGYRL